MISIAIDGPSGSGKSTLAKKIAQALGFVYVDTGALYRTIAYFIINENVGNYDEKELKETLAKIKIDINHINGEQRMILNNEDVTERIRTPEISMVASKFSAILFVREFLLDLQLEMARKNNIVMDGRDIGTVILPNAQVKIFLTASPHVRATRRYNEYMNKNENVLFEDVLTDIIKRDTNDKERSISPLKQANDAVLLDTSTINLDETFEKMIDIVNKKIGKEFK